MRFKSLASFLVAVCLLGGSVTGLAQQKDLPPSYTSYGGGVFTFRGDASRGNAAYAQAEMTEQKMTLLWDTVLGRELPAVHLLDQAALAWASQPVIIKWAIEWRYKMLDNSEYRDEPSLKEVIFPGRDGRLHFINLRDGKPTRPALEINALPLSSASIQTEGIPLLALYAAQPIGNERWAKGLKLYDLTSNQLLYGNMVYADWDKRPLTCSAPLFLYQDDRMLAFDGNGMALDMTLQSALNAKAMSFTIAPELKLLETPAPIGPMPMQLLAHDGALIIASGSFVLSYALETGLENWRIRLPDEWMEAPKAALALDQAGHLYTAMGTEQGDLTHVWLNCRDAATCEMKWERQVQSIPAQDQIPAAQTLLPNPGQYLLSDLVFLTTSQGKQALSAAYNKQTGAEIWQRQLADNAQTQPVLVYDESGRGYLIQALQNGQLHLLDGRTGSDLDMLQLPGVPCASPAVYMNVLTIPYLKTDGSLHMAGVQLH